ncbi:MAG: hypothetical protein CMM37_10475 [Rhodospirillaceae bacterium]|nr:hypothetical protein [Rhodospirillaceae bacterium]
MSIKVIEINDSNIRVGDETGIVFQSPGFALVTEDKLEVGEFAERQSRIQPTNSFSKYWYELNLEPISHGPKVRHHADLAYAQLMHLAEAADIDQDVIFSVPGNFSQDQLAILLGLARQTNFSPIGFVNSALADSIQATHKKLSLHIDIQLHQVVITTITINEAYFKVKNVVQIPGVGIQNFMNLMMQVATDLFIDQCRFNPQHDAISEQDLYNLLLSWLSNHEEGRTVQFELESRDTVHLAKLPWENLTAVLDRYYRKINEQISALTVGVEAQLILSECLSRLPGFLRTIPSDLHYEVATVHQGARACIDHRNLIAPKDGEIKLVEKLAKSELGIVELVSKTELQQSQLASHLLFCNEAIKLRRVVIGSRLGKPEARESSQEINLAMKGLPEHLGTIDKTDSGIYFNCTSNHAILNNRSVSKGIHLLQLGDHIRFAESCDEIRLIKVRNG